MHIILTCKPVSAGIALSGSATVVSKETLFEACNVRGSKKWLCHSVRPKHHAMEFYVHFHVPQRVNHTVLIVFSLSILNSLLLFVSEK